MSKKTKKITDSRRDGDFLDRVQVGSLPPMLPRSLCSELGMRVTPG